MPAADRTQTARKREPILAGARQFHLAIPLERNHGPRESQFSLICVPGRGFIHRDMEEATLRAFLTRNGGEQLPYDDSYR